MTPEPLRATGIRGTTRRRKANKKFGSRMNENELLKSPVYKKTEESHGGKIILLFDNLTPGVE
jgi:hypothetical protein